MVLVVVTPQENEYRRLRSIPSKRHPFFDQVLSQVGQDPEKREHDFPIRTIKVQNGICRKGEKNRLSSPAFFIQALRNVFRLLVDDLSKLPL